MKKTLRTVLIIVGIMILAFSFTACGNDSSNEGVVPSNDPLPSPTQESQTSNDTAKDSSAGTEYPDIIASLAQLPGLAESPDKGAFVDLVKAMDDVYPGKIKIEVVPFARSVDNVVNGKADFHMPTLRNIPGDKSPAFVVDESKLPFRTATKNVGILSFLIYSHVDEKITKDILDKASADKATFPYKLEASGGLESNVPFPVLASNDLAQCVEKTANKRIDGFVWAQEESDMIIKQLKAKTIHREHWGDFQDAIVIAKGERGDKIDKILTDCIEKMEASGKLKELYSKVHGPFDNWQPAQMGW